MIGSVCRVARVGRWISLSQRENRNWKAAAAAAATEFGSITSLRFIGKLTEERENKNWEMSWTVMYGV